MRVKDLDIDEEELEEIARQARLELIRRAAAKKDIFTWGKLLFPEKFTKPFCKELHEYFFEIRNEQLTATEAPRSSAKTTIRCFLIPIFQALEETEKYNHYTFVQSTERKAFDINRSLKMEFETNEFLMEIYGDQIGEMWTDGKFVLKNSVVFSAISAGQSIRGLNYRNKRPDYIVVDDLFDEDDIHNPESTEKKNDWFWSSLYPARAKTKNYCVHVQGTAINSYDLLVDMKSKKNVIFKSFKMVKDFDEQILLWPELSSWDEVMDEKEVTPETIWDRENQNERSDDKRSFIRREWLYPAGGKSWEYDPMALKFDEHHKLIEVLLCCDPSIGEKEKDDFTGIAKIIKTRYDDSEAFNFYIDSLWNEHWTLDERVINIQNIIKVPVIGDKKVNCILIEAIAGFKDFARETQRRVNCAVRLIDHVKDKITNLENKSKHFQNGHVFVNKNIEKRLKDKLVHQLTTNYPKNDDLRDCLLLSMDGKPKPSIRVFDNE